MGSLHIVIPGDPVAMGRPRAYKSKQGAIRMYTPKSSSAWRKIAQVAMRKAWPNNPIESPIEIDATFLFKYPVSRIRKTNPKMHVTVHAQKPDLDNLIKAVLDAANGLLFVDDGQVSEITASKWFSPEGDAAQVIVRVEW